MDKENKKNLISWLWLVASALIAVSAVATLINISGGLWPVALPSSGAALAAAVLIFKRKFYDVYRDDKPESTGRARDPKTGRFVKR